MNTYLFLSGKSFKIFIFQKGEVKVIIGKKDDTGVQICELTLPGNTCEWYDSIAVVTWSGTEATPAGKVTVTYPAA